jgi:hypothetical protein
MPLFLLALGLFLPPLLPCLDLPFLLNAIRPASLPRLSHLPVFLTLKLRLTALDLAFTVGFGSVLELRTQLFNIALGRLLKAALLSDLFSFQPTQVFPLGPLIGDLFVFKFI